MRLRERLAAGFVDDPRQVDDRGGALRDARQRRRIAGVGLDDLDRRQREERAGAFAPARHDDGVATGARQPADQMATDETRAADDDDPGAGHRQFACAATVVPAPRGGTVPRRVVSGWCGWFNSRA